MEIQPTLAPPINFNPSFTLDQMFNPMVNSPATILTNPIGSSDTTITIEDGSILPIGPNLATIGLDADAETVRYSSIFGKTVGEITTFELSGVTRGFQGTAREWNAGTPISRNFTAYDQSQIQKNLNSLANKATEIDTLANTAQLTALDAATAANNAQLTATNAAGAASTAQNTAVNALNAANNAETLANNAQTTANTANTTANTAQAAVNGKVNKSGDTMTGQLIIATNNNTQQIWSRTESRAEIAQTSTVLAFRKCNSADVSDATRVEFQINNPATNGGLRDTALTITAFNATNGNVSGTQNIWGSHNLPVSTGTWTPVASTACPGLSITFFGSRFWYRIGRLVFIMGNMNVGRGTAMIGNTLGISGLPFAPHNVDQRLICTGSTIWGCGAAHLTTTQNNSIFPLDATGNSMQVSVLPTSGTASLTLCGCYVIA